MPARKNSLEKPLTERQKAELQVYAALLGGLANQVLNSEDGEVFRAIRKEAVHATDVFFAEVA